MSLRSKLDNIWYHYKSYILAGVFLIFTILFSLHSCVTKTSYDIRIYYVAGSSSMYSEQLNWIKQAVELHCGDVNGDGKVEVSITGLRVDEYTDPSVRAQYMTPVQAGEIMLFFGDKGGMEYLHKNGYLKPIPEFAGNADSDYLWKVNGTGLSTQVEGFEMFSDVDLYVALRSTENTLSFSFEDCKENYEVACNTLRSMISVESRYDLRVYWLYQQTELSAKQTQWIRNAVTTYCTDFNSDGEVSVDVVALNLATKTTYKKYLSAIRTEDRYLLFGDEAAMTTLASEKILPSLDGIAEPLHESGGAWLVNGSAFATKTEGFDCFGESKIYATVRDLSSSEPEINPVLRDRAQAVFARFFISEE